VVIITAEDPRSEKVEDIIEEIGRGIKRTKDVYKILERGEAIRFAINDIAKKGDLVIICGKGHEKSMAYGKTEYPWSDVEAVKKALNNESLVIKRS
jgi:UDP-N-acetylmuramoyl-L-alanyl-D-glutamate--2,6-diaminopimelate ligase